MESTDKNVNHKTQYTITDYAIPRISSGSYLFINCNCWPVSQANYSWWSRKDLHLCIWSRCKINLGVTNLHLHRLAVDKLHWWNKAVKDDWRFITWIKKYRVQFPLHCKCWITTVKHVHHIIHFNVIFNY